MLGFLKKIFGGKDKNAKLDFTDSLEEIDMDLDVSFNSNDDTFEDKDYKYNHLFIYYLIEDGMFDSISETFMDYDGSDGLGVLRNQEDIFIIDSGVTKKGSKISIEDGIDSTISNFNADERFSSKSGKEFLEVLNNNKGVIQSRLKGEIEKWGEEFDEDFDYESFEAQVDTIPMMFIFFKSTKPFDPSDTQSESQGNLNRQMTSRDGFIRTSMFAAADSATNEKIKKEWDRCPTQSISYIDVKNEQWHVENVGKDVIWLDSDKEETVIQI